MSNTRHASGASLPRPRSWRVGPWFVSLVVLAMGGFFLAFSIGLHHVTTPIPGGVTTDATVVAIDVHSSVKRTYQVPTLRFTDRTGTVHEVGGDQTSGLHVGDTVRLSYDPTDPGGRTHELRNTHGWIGALVAAVCFLILGIGAVVLTVRGQRTRARST